MILSDTFASRIKFWVPCCLSMIWLSILSQTDAYYSVYVIVCFLSFFLRIKKDCKIGGGEVKKGMLSGLSAGFSGAVLLANYPIFTSIGDPAYIGRSTCILMNAINACLCFGGGICVIKPILLWLYYNFPIRHTAYKRFSYEKNLPIIIFASIVLLNFIHLFFVEYPGNLTEDSFSQISEMVQGEYSDFNTFWHTVLFECVLSVGYFLFNNINAAVAFVCVFQIIIMAFAFTYCLMTMRYYGVPEWFLILCFGLYLLMPYNMALLITIWKDVLFAGGCLILLSSLARIQTGIGNLQWHNFLVFIFGSLLFIISRSNGWLIYFVMTVIYLLFCRGVKLLSWIMAFIAVFGWFLLNPALTMLGISGADVVESLSVPVQQVSRVISEGCPLSQEEEQLLSKVVDLDEVAQIYTEWLSDPVKTELRSNDYDYFVEHFKEYRQLWVRLGLRYPWVYLKAWIEQTKGYWNAGYSYAMYSETITDNFYGIEKSGGSHYIAALFRLYFGVSRHLILFEPLHSIGLHVWIAIACFVLNVYRKRRQFILAVPVLLLVIGLMLGTPVYCCFRYVYPLFVSLPLILGVTLWDYTPGDTT